MTLTRKEIMEAVKDSDWQEFRISLKGLPTKRKLERLAVWKEDHKGRKAEVQVENYINALKRGGQIK
jgi:hypothetical protein